MAGPPLHNHRLNPISGALRGIMSEATSTRDDRLHQASWLTRLLRRPELGAVAGTILIIAFFTATAGGTGLFSPKGHCHVP